MRPLSARPLNTLTEAAFARRRGVTRACVTWWKGKGLVQIIDGKVDVAASEKLLDARPAEYRGGRATGQGDNVTLPARGQRRSKKTKDQANNISLKRGSDPSTWSTAEAIRMKEIASARLKQIEADTAAGLVVPIADVAKQVAAEYQVVRSALLGLASKLAHRLAAANTPEAAGALVDQEVREMLKALTADARPR